MTSAERINPFQEKQSSFWDKYQKGRPWPPPSFWDRIYDYHSSHGGGFDVVHDVGAGVGKFSSVLKKKFKKVIVTDPSEINVSHARDILGSDPTFEFVQATMEEEIQPSESVDFVFCCNTLHWTNVSEALASATSQLKPNGTLVIALFAIPVFSNNTVLEIWHEMMKRRVEAWKRSLPNLEDFSKAGGIEESGYDAVQLPEAFSNVQRIKLNASEGNHVFEMSPITPGKAPVMSSHIRETESVIRMEDPSWRFKKDLQGVRDMLESFPMPGEAQGMDQLWQDMSRASTGGTYDGFWPVSIILATRGQCRISNAAAHYALSKSLTRFAAGLKIVT